MFPNVRLMAASTLASIMALFFAFGVYASMRISHEPLPLSSRRAPLQLVGLNVAMLPITVLEPFARQHSTPVAAEASSVLAYSAAQVSKPPPSVTGTADTHEDDATADAPVENSDVTKTNSDATQMPDAASIEAVTETESPDDATQESVEPVATLPSSVTESAPLPAPSPLSPPPAASSSPQNPLIEKTAVIETAPTTAAGGAAVAIKIHAKERKKHVARRRLYRAKPRAVAQISAPPVTSYPAGIGGPFVRAPSR